MFLQILLNMRVSTAKTNCNLYSNKIVADWIMTVLMTVVKECGMTALTFLPEGRDEGD
jgi:hypothetical protein